MLRMGVSKLSVASLVFSWTVILSGLVSFVAAQGISLSDIPLINSSIIENYVKSRDEYIEAEHELRQGMLCGARKLMKLLTMA